MRNIPLTGEAAAQAQLASRDNSIPPQSEANMPQEVTAARVPPASAAGALTGGDSSASDRALTKGSREQSLSDLMADAPIVAETPDGPVLEGKLSPGQINVLREVMAGKSIMAAAKNAHVSRSTIYRWQSEDPHFIAALNAWKRQMDESMRNRLLALADRAVTAINNALLSCDTKAATTLLKELGMLSPVRHGSTDPKVVEDELKLNRFESQIQVREQQRCKDERWTKADRGW